MIALHAFWEEGPIWQLSLPFMHIRFWSFDPETQQNGDEVGQLLKGAEEAPPNIVQSSSVENVGKGVDGRLLGDVLIDGDLLGIDEGEPDGFSDGWHEIRKRMR